MPRRNRRPVVRAVNPYANVRQWPTQPEDDAYEGEFVDRYVDTSLVGDVPPGTWQDIQAKTRSGVPQSAGAVPGSLVENVPVGIGPPTPTIRQARFVNLAATVTTGRSVQLLAANSKRTYLLVQNTSGSTIFVTFDRPATISTGVQIIAAGNFEPLTPPVSSVWAISLVANLPVVVIEGTT